MQLTSKKVVQSRHWTKKELIPKLVEHQRFGDSLISLSKKKAIDLSVLEILSTDKYEISDCLEKAIRATNMIAFIDRDLKVNSPFSPKDNGYLSISSTSQTNWNFELEVFEKRKHP